MVIALDCVARTLARRRQAAVPILGGTPQAAPPLLPAPPRFGLARSVDGYILLYTGGRAVPKRVATLARWPVVGSALALGFYGAKGFRALGFHGGQVLALWR